MRGSATLACFLRALTLAYPLLLLLLPGTHRAEQAPTPDDGSVSSGSARLKSDDVGKSVRDKRRHSLIHWSHRCVWFPPPPSPTNLYVVFHSNTPNSAWTMWKGHLRRWRQLLCAPFQNGCLPPACARGYCKELLEHVVVRVNFLFDLFFHLRLYAIVYPSEIGQVRNTSSDRFYTFWRCERGHIKMPNNTCI